MSTTSSRNFTTLYSGTGSVVPQGAYGNANVVSLLNVGTDGANTVANIVATGNISAASIGNGSANISFSPVAGGPITFNVVSGPFDPQMTINDGFAPDATVVIRNTLEVLDEITVPNISSVTIVNAGNITTGGFFIGNFIGNISGNVVAAGANTQVQFNDGGTLGAAAGLTFNKTSNALVVTGNITGGNVAGTTVSATTVSATANITGGNVNTGGVVSAAGNITGGNVLTPGQVTATGNVSGGNVLTPGQVTATGNVTGNYILGNGSQLTGLPATYGNANVSNFLANGFGSNTISTTGNITSGNLITSTVNGVGTANLTLTAGPSFSGAATGVVLNAGQIIVGRVGVGAGITGANQLDLGIRPGYAQTDQPQITLRNYTGPTNGNLDLISALTGTVGTINLYGNTNIGATANVPGSKGNLIVANAVYVGESISAAGNITGNVFTGNGSQLTGINAANIIGAYGNANVANFLGNGFGSNTITTTGNITTGNLLTGGIVSATGNITGGNVTTVGLITATGNINGANLVATANLTSTQQTIIGTANNGSAGNIVMSGKNIATDMAWLPDGGNAVTAVNGRILVGTGFAGNNTHTAIQQRLFVNDSILRGNTGTTVQLFASDPIVSLTGNVTNNAFRQHGIGSRVRIGGGSAGNTIALTAGAGAVGAVAALQPNIEVGNVTPYLLGNTTISHAVLNGGFFIMQPGGFVTNAYGMAPGATVISPTTAATAGNITNYLGFVNNLSSSPNITGNLYAYYHGNATSSVATGGIAVANTARAATNYYFLRNDDAVAQVQLGSLRSYNEFRYDTATTGTIAIDKTNAQVQYIAPTANVTISGYSNMVTTLSDSVNNDQQIDTLTVLVQQGATPYTVTLPTGATYQYAGNINTVPAVANSRSVLTVIAANVAGTVNYFTTVQTDQNTQAPAAGSNTQVQFNDSGTFGATAGLTFNKTSNAMVVVGNVTGGNLLTVGLISATGNVDAGNLITGGLVTATGNITGGNLITAGTVSATAATANVALSNVVIVSRATNSGQQIYPATAPDLSGAATAINPGRMLFGNGFQGNVSNGVDTFNRQTRTRFGFWDTVQLPSGFNTPAENMVSTAQFQLTGNTGTQARLFSVVNFNNITSEGVANTFTSTGTVPAAAAGFNCFVNAGNWANSTTGGMANVGNVIVNTGAGGVFGTVVFTGSTMGNSYGIVSTQQSTNGTINNQIYFSAWDSLSGTPSTPGNVFVYHNPGTTNSYGVTHSNIYRAATNYYFLRNDDTVAQVQLGSLRSYNEFQYSTATSGTVNIDKTNAQVQFLNPTANVTIGDLQNFVTTANDGTNNDSQTDTVTLIIQQGATPYTVTMPTGNAAIKYAGGVSTVGATANAVSIVTIKAVRSAANAALYLTSISSEYT